MMARFEEISWVAPVLELIRRCEADYARPYNGDPVGDRCDGQAMLDHVEIARHLGSHRGVSLD